MSFIYLLYKKTVVINDTSFDVEIIDLSADTDRSQVPQEPIQWSDAIILVYSITDRDSFNYANTMLDNLQQYREVTPIPVVLVGNKADLKVRREVYTNEGKATADKFGCIFFETSVSESSNDVHEVFWAIFNELKSTRSNAFRRLRKFSVTKIMTLLFGKEYSRMAPNAQSGTVTVLKKDELSKTLEVK
ncbi:hypothetical protein V9T40_010080 [Parthenolecanium corni]|uniref:small monomeric GTPase n=1 Tax=Parthenolecanium corni TaxID=536013 RepID=A0AAN9TXC6_9HEMI